MTYGDDDLSPPYVSSYHASGPYSESLSSSASSSTSSVWCDAASQSSDDASVTSASTADTDLSDTYCAAQQAYQPILGVCEQAVPTTVWPKTVPEVRSHPRRSSGSGTRSGCPPSLVRQCDRKVNFVDGLVDTTAQIIEVIWPLSSTSRHCDLASKDLNGNKGVLPLRVFIQETLRRSRTSYSTLQVALYYLILIKPHVPQKLTQEQREDSDSYRALQCGRRMFLSALILASKYLQDRNYSARAWSKISGLNTQEINQNELAFLLAVKWKLHITEDVFQTWANIVLKYTPTQPPSPGSNPVRSGGDRAPSWRELILSLTPELDNVEEFLHPAPAVHAERMPPNFTSSRPVVERSCAENESSESTPTQRFYTPQVMEPPPSAKYSSRQAPALGLLPTPRLTPQIVGYNTPAAGGVSCGLAKSSMCFAMAQAPPVSAERWPVNGSSPFSLTRRSSLANSVSSMSSPESMVSDNSVSSRSSRSSSISSASSLMGAPANATKLDVQARCRYAKQQMRSVGFVSVPEVAFPFSSSPESYAGPVGKELLDLSLGTPAALRDMANEYFMSEASSDKEAAAARALQELHCCPRLESPRRAPKRARPLSAEGPMLQENVRQLLTSSMQPSAAASSQSGAWNASLVRAAREASPAKRVCCSTEAGQDLAGPAGARPGMWEGILN